jgi:hypothetical protein
MTEPSDPREPTPHMRRLADSISRSTDTLRTQPGRLSRSLAPSRSGRRRLWHDLQLLLLAMLPFAIAAFVMMSRSGHGAWVIVQASAPPWQPGRQPHPAVRALVGEQVVFERQRVRAPAPLACSAPRYQQVSVAPEGLFQGALAGRPDVAQRIATLGFTGPEIATLRVDCDNASFDYHRTGNVLLTLLDGVVVRLAPR